VKSFGKNFLDGHVALLPCFLKQATSPRFLESLSYAGRSPECNHRFDRDSSRGR
jgi:hypothetical protein